MDSDGCAHLELLEEVPDSGCTKHPQQCDWSHRRTTVAHPQEPINYYIASRGGKKQKTRPCDCSHDGATLAKLTPPITSNELKTTLMSPTLGCQAHFSKKIFGGVISSGLLLFREERKGIIEWVFRYLASIEVAELAGRFGRTFVELRHTLSHVR